MSSQPVENDPYKASTFIGHSLWMCPTGAARMAYQDAVKATSDRFGTFAFQPHVTLVAAIMTPVEDVLQRTRALAAELAPYSFELEKVSHRDAYFQCVYAQMKKTPEVVQANTVARDFFPEKQSDPPYMPHLSLVYGNFDDATKQDMILPFLEDQLQTKEPQSLTIPVDAIELWSTQGDVKEWYLVESIPLTGKPTTTIKDGAPVNGDTCGSMN